MSVAGRSALIAVSGALFVAAVAGAAEGAWPAGGYLAVLSGCLFVGTLFERFRYKKLHCAAVPSGWVETTERFIDPETGKLVTVFYEPDSGRRHYVARPEA